MFKRMNCRSKGITLIALVITIIVLLILAGVSIAMLTGENGILKKVADAGNKSKIAEEEEQIKLAYNAVLMDKLNKGSKEMVTAEDLQTELEKLAKDVVVTDAKNEVGEKTGDINVKFSSGNSYTVDGEGNIKGPNGKTDEEDMPPTGSDVTPPEVSSEIQYIDPIYEKPTPKEPTGGSIYTEQDTGEKVPLPKDFAVKEGTVNSGLVVTGPDGSEFVWIPVPYVVATGEDTAEEKIKGSATITIDATDESGIGKITNKTEDNIEKLSDNKYKVTENGDYTFDITDTKGNNIEYTATVDNIQEMVTGNKAMAVNLESKDYPKYRGLLYNFTVKTEGISTSEVRPNCTIVENDHKEPANLTGKPEKKEYEYDSEQAFKDNGGETWTETMYQEEYNKMIEKVEDYKGFYVGRYEMSLTGSNNSSVDPNGTAQSKPNLMTASAAAKEANTWYGLYKKAMTYANESNKEATITDCGVISSMIWGSQYDAIMNWMQKNEIDVASGKSTYNDTRITGKQDDKDKINNIYDLLGCNYEWTIEAYNTEHKVSRGGYSAKVLAPSCRNVNYPTYTHSNVSSRLTLYIK